MTFLNLKTWAIGLCVVVGLPQPLRAEDAANDDGLSARKRGPISFLRGAPPEDPGTLFRWPNQSPDASVAGLDEPMVTDRPDFTEAGSVVGLGVAQLESGYTYTHESDGASRLIGHAFPETLLRVGVLADWLEFRTAWNYSAEDLIGARSHGAEDLYLGFKVGLTAQDAWLPEMAIIPQMTVPTGARARSSHTTLPGVNWLYGWDINDFLATGGSTQFNHSVDADDGTAYVEWAQSWTVNYSLTDRVGAYTEWFGLFPNGATSAHTEHYFDAGFTFLSSDNVQWDVRAGKGLSQQADDYFVGAGLSLRFF